ncbi:MAG: ABC transporter permease [Polyangiaceae bacterium]|nr:ABC transporter permease [Polyangiaceae bacterium]
MSVQTGQAVPSGPVSRRFKDRARYRFDLFRADPNPIWIRELKQAVRLARTPVILCVLTMLMTMLIAGIGGLAAADASPSTTGITLFHVFFSLAYFVVTLVGPTVAANGIAAEREGRTWEAVLLAGLPPGMIARGKFLAAYTTISLYIVMLAPVGALPFLFGGVTATETIVAFLFLFLIALMSVAFGLALSSKMTSMRGAIAVTLLLALPFSIITFILFGPVLSIAAHKAWPGVPEGPPIWLPTAYSRAPFDIVYVMSLFVGPVVAVVVPAWFMYEVTIANLTSPTDDRSTGLKRWFLVCVPILALVGTAPIIGAIRPQETMALSMLSLGVFFLILTFCVFLFQGDAIGPSRRVTAHWDRVRTGSFSRFLGPSVTRTALLQLVIGVLGLGLLAALGAVLSATRQSYAWEGPEQVVLFALYCVGFFVFQLGLGTYARARSSTATTARLILAGTVVALLITPWVIAAIVGVLGSSGGWNDDLLSVAAPSPFFVFYAIDKVDDSTPGFAPFASVLCSFAYLILGFISLIAAGRRSAQIIDQHNKMLAETDRLLAQEDEAAESARIEAERAQAEAAAQAANPPAAENAQLVFTGAAEEPT